MSSAKIKSPAELARIREQLRRDGASVVQCHGCFDIVHPGHIRYLRFAKDQGDVLIVSVSSDRQIDKGVQRPYIGEDLRLENLAVLEMVDYVCLDDHGTAEPILEQLQPDVYVKGKEYEHASDPRFARERAIVEGYGGSVIFSSGEVVYSSTFIINEFKERFDLEREKVESYCRRHGVTRAALRELHQAIAGKRLLVIGDPIIDRYVHCECLGVAAESPTLDVRPLSEDRFVGAAGLIAGQAAALGAHVSFLSAIPHGPEGDVFVEGLAALGVEVVGPRVADRPVYEKTRFLVEDKKVFKTNRGRYAPMTSAQTRAFVEELSARGGDFDGWILSDFGYGLFGEELFVAAQSVASQNSVPVFFDVSRGGAGSLLRLEGVRLATPTEEELRTAFADRQSGLSNLASRYHQATGVAQVFVTLGKRGVVTFEPDPQGASARMLSDYLPALGGQAIDPVGAGDVFLASAALATMAGGASATAAYLGSAVASLHVQRLGNSPVDWVEVERWMQGRSELAS